MKMYVLMVADTTEVNVGKACGLNIKRVDSTFQRIANFIGCTYVPRRVMGPSYNKPNVISEIKLMKPSSKDIIVFYYTGHGYRKKEDKRRYPYLDLRVLDTDNYLVETLNMEDINKMMTDKRARLTLVFSECCNTYVGAGNPVGPPPLAKKSIPPQMSMKNVRTLFLDPNRKSVLATAADSTQKASINPDFGGFFSYCLKNAIEVNSSKDALAPSWYNILDEARTQTFRMANRANCAETGQPTVRCYQLPCSVVK